MSSSCWVHRNANDLVTKCTSGSRNLIRLGGERARCHHWRRRNVENVRRAGKIPCARGRRRSDIYFRRDRFYRRRRRVLVATTSRATPCLRLLHIAATQKLAAAKAYIVSRD